MMIEQQSPFLALPQEVRDLIYGFAFDETLSPPTQFKEFVDDKELTPETPPSAFRTLYPSTPPRPAWYALLLTCRQTAADVREYFASAGCSDDTASLTVTLTSTTATTIWTALPTASPQNLEIELLLTHPFDARLLHPYPSAKDNLALRSIFNVLKRYITRGPFLPRPTPLASPNSLETVRISVQPAWKEEDMAFFFGNPAEQFRVVVEGLKGWIAASLCDKLVNKHHFFSSRPTKTQPEPSTTKTQTHPTKTKFHHHPLNKPTVRLTPPPSKMSSSSKPTSAVYDELIATQQIKLKEAQKTIDAGFESAYATLRKYQNKMAVLKVEEAEENKKREEENKKREEENKKREEENKKREEENKKREEENKKYEEGLEAWEAKSDQKEELLDQIKEQLDQMKKELAQKEKNLEERERELAARETDVEKLENEFVVVEKGPEQDKSIGHQDKSIGHQDKSIGEQMSLEERIALGRRLEQVMHDLTKDDELDEDQDTEVQVMEDLTKDDDLDEDQETDFQPGSGPPKSRVDSVAPADPPSQKQDSPAEKAKPEPATEDPEPNFVYLTENVAGVTRVGTRDGIEELLLHGKRFKRMGTVTPTMRAKVTRLAMHKKKMGWQGRGS
ncbi:hypothetical protein PRZ48_004389 [Zasmidium cellare]|uniref:Uncharacterized protein n=1 Tax=Zasmidium cellare TaxID=395010 RepID=A0ABR0EQ26_ZASCE|nr:hypothetical protein PRZ48_004389 [Zasmidium cellare]